MQTSSLGYGKLLKDSLKTVGREQLCTLMAEVSNVLVCQHEEPQNPCKIVGQSGAHL